MVTSRLNKAIDEAGLHLFSPVELKFSLNFDRSYIGLKTEYGKTIYKAPVGRRIKRFAFKDKGVVVVELDNGEIIEFVYEADDDQN